MPHTTISEVPWEAQELADDLTRGKPEIGWKGDPRLELRIGYITAAHSGYSNIAKRHVNAGDPVDWRYEVWRHNEDGKDTPISRWRPDEFHTILTDLVAMDPRTPGHEDAHVVNQRHMKAAHRENARQIREAFGEMAEHRLSIEQHIQNGRLTHYMNDIRQAEKAAEKAKEKTVAGE